MSTLPQTPTRMLALILLLTLVLCACQPETIEVTRVKIMERRVIERIIVTVEVTRIQRVVVTPRPTTSGLVPPGDVNLTPSPSQASSTLTPTAAPRAPAATATSPSSARETGERLLTAVRDMEQTLLSLVQALNSVPLPNDRILELYAGLEAAPTFPIPEGNPELQAFYSRYREQVDFVLGQSIDLRTHLQEIAAGTATQTEVSPIHLGLARDAASAATSNLQALSREVEGYTASQP